MKITREDLRWAASREIISAEQAERLWSAFDERFAARSRFDAANVAYYFGALIVIGAMGWFLTQAWEQLGGFGLFAIAAAYATVFVLAGRTLWDRHDLRVPGGLLFVMAVCMTPLAVYGLERASGWWVQGDPGTYRGYFAWVKGSWFPIETATIASGLVALRYRRFAFLTAPIAFSLWFMSMDAAPLLLGKARVTADERAWVSMVFGAAMLFAAYVVDLRVRDSDDFAFWGYVFGLMAFWGGLTAMDSDSELSKFAYCLVNLGLVACSVILRQRAFIVFGGLGVSGYLGHLSYNVFKDSLLFPVALSAIGILIIYCGVSYQRNAAAVEAFVQERLPASIRGLVPARARQE